MSFSFRCVARSKVARVVSVGVVGATLGLPAAAAYPAPARPDFVAQGACSGSTVTREYTPEAMTFRLHLDLDGCRWWDGSARNLVIWLSRDDGAGPASRYAMTACEGGADPASRTTTCEVFATLPHPPRRERRQLSGRGDLGVAGRHPARGVRNPLQHC